MKLLNVKIVFSSTATMITYRMPGSVTCRNRRQVPRVHGGRVVLLGVDRLEARPGRG